MEKPSVACTISGAGQFGSTVSNISAQRAGAGDARRRARSPCAELADHRARASGARSAAAARWRSRTSRWRGPGPRIATTAMASSRLGSASITSISRMIDVLGAAAAEEAGDQAEQRCRTTSERPTETRPIASDSRVPWIRRESMSRPTGSVPSRKTWPPPAPATAARSVESRYCSLGRMRRDHVGEERAEDEQPTTTRGRAARRGSARKRATARARATAARRGSGRGDRRRRRVMPWRMRGLITP